MHIKVKPTALKFFSRYYTAFFLASLITVNSEGLRNVISQISANGRIHADNYKTFLLNTHLFQKNKNYKISTTRNVEQTQL